MPRSATKNDLQIASLEQEVKSLIVNNEQLAKRLHTLEEMIDTRNTHWWKRLLFRIDGWPPWYVVAPEPANRPWRKWWTS
jgi:hypothetical protein